MPDKKLEKNISITEQPTETPASEMAPIAEMNENENNAEIPTQEAPKSAETTTKPRRRPNQFQKIGPVVSQVRDEVTIRIEKILEDGIGDAYQRLSPVAQQEFKLKGEEVAIKIRSLLKSSHVKVKKIFSLIFEWLKMLPGVNQFFLEQEAKIKTDRIVTLHEHKS